MRKAVATVLVILICTQALPAQQPLAITRVLLYKNGMAYIVRTGQLAGPLSLTFHPEDMNDVLKSFSAWNPDTGALYSVGYTAGIPSSHMLSRFPFDISSPETGLGAFLLQVKGAEVRFDHNGRDVTGKLVAVQQSNRVTAPQTTADDYRLTMLLRDASLQTVWLSDVRSVEFVDAQLRDQLKAYLEVLASGRQDVTREVSVYPVPGTGPIQVAYLQQFPLWKTSYRVDLGAAQSRIQGWAQIDNPTGEAWENVSVSLLSGAPVSFTMNMYDPLYARRAAVPVPGGQVAAPRQYEAALQGRLTVPTAAPAAPATVDAVALSAPLDESATRRAAGNLLGMVPGTAGGGGRGGGAAQASAAPIASAVFQQADTSRTEDFYEYKFPFPVRIASRQSALLPFLQKTLNVERLSIFNARSDRGNPRLGARLENNTDIPFEAGPVTFFQDTRYAGEAVLDYLPRGERALISYGVDHEIQVSSRQQQAEPESMARLTVSRGVAVLFMESVQTTTYEIRNKGLESRHLVVEHPRIPGRTLRGIEASETTESFYRFGVPLAAGQATTLSIPETISRQTNVTLTTMTRPQLALFAGRATPPELRARLGEVVDLQEQIATLKGELQSTQGTIDTMFRDQERLRENLKALGNSTGEQQLKARYLDQLRKQEDQIDAGQASIRVTNTRIADTQARLGDLIARIVFE